MPVSLEQLVKDARTLPLAERERLVAELIRDLEPADDASREEIEAAWDTEIARRLHDIDSGKVKGIPSEEVFARLRAKRDETR